MDKRGGGWPSPPPPGSSLEGNFPDTLSVTTPTHILYKYKYVAYVYIIQIHVVYSYICNGTTLLKNLCCTLTHKAIRRLTASSHKSNSLVPLDLLGHQSIFLPLQLHHRVLFPDCPHCHSVLPLPIESLDWLLISSPAINEHSYSTIIVHKCNKVLVTPPSLFTYSYI